MLFDTTLGGAAFDPLDVAFQESVGYQNTHFVNGPLGAPYTCLAGTAVGYSGSLAADILDGGTNATLNFTDFARGEAWGFYVDFDKRTANTNPAGADMNYAQIMVSFTLSGQFLDTLTYDFGTFSGSKKSFPTEMGNLNGPSKQVEFVPEPCAAVLALAGASLLGLSRRRPLRISPGSYERELVDRNDWKPVS
jgi:hypothetical protein